MWLGLYCVPKSPDNSPYDLNANPEGIPGVYEVNGRQYVAFCASYYGSLDPGVISTFPGNAENQVYYVFALPR
jgi:hypothetical protein